MSKLTQQLDNIPATPGVYIYKDIKGAVLYVGKAKLLRNRVRSYFQPSAELEPAKQQMVRKVADIETISTDNEVEALIVEANLIRKHQPPYNVVLRDDKYYLFIKITNEELPRVFLTRRIKKGDGRYFGPYSSAKSVRSTLILLRRIFPHRGESDSPHEIIFPHPLFSQDGTPTGQLSEHIYKENIQNITRFLSGKREDITQTLREGMKAASSSRHFERAAIFRDQLKAIERLEGTQKVYLPQKESFDVISVIRSKNQSAANVFQIREGKLLGKNTFLLAHRSTASAEDTLRQFLLQYYGVAQDIPKTILVPYNLEDHLAIAQWINEELPPVFAVPRRGKKRQLLSLGETNAQLLLDAQAVVFSTRERVQRAHAELVKAVGLVPEKVHRIETYDISNIQGQLATASMVVFVDGEKQPSQYRKFRMNIEGVPNDFAMMRETLYRRFANHKTDWPTPDLVIIDGGKGQLSSAAAILNELNIPVPVISIAKREEEIFLPRVSDSIRLPFDSDALYLIQRMRDEAHRFTITYHRLLRSKRQKRSLLDEVPGIGPKTKKLLINRFGSLKGIRQASDDELVAAIGQKKTKILRDFL